MLRYIVRAFASFVVAFILLRPVAGLPTDSWAVVAMASLGVAAVAMIFGAGLDQAGLGTDTFLGTIATIVVNSLLVVGLTTSFAGASVPQLTLAICTAAILTGIVIVVDFVTPPGPMLAALGSPASKRSEPRSTPMSV